MEKQSIYHLIKDVASDYSDRPMYWIKNPEGEFFGVSYGDWYKNLEKLSMYFLDKGIKKGDHIGLICDNRYEWLLCSLSAVTIGAADVPRGCDATADDIEYILNHSECKIVFIETDKVLKKISDISDKFPLLTTFILIDPLKKFRNLDFAKQAFPKAEFLHLNDALTVGEELVAKKTAKSYHEVGQTLGPNDLATIIYTSGTTGAPKGVMLNHRNFTWGVHQIQEVIPISTEDRTIIFLPPWHIAERLLETGMVSVGASMGCSSVPTIAADLKKVRPTAIVSVPRVWEGLYKRILDTIRKSPVPRQKIFYTAQKIASIYFNLKDTVQDKYCGTHSVSRQEKIINRIVASILLVCMTPLNFVAQLVLNNVREIFGGALRFALCGAGAMPPHISLFFRSCEIPIIETYGMTETTGLGAMGEFLYPKIGAIGPTLPGAHIKLLDEKGNVVTKPGDKGVAWHKGPHVTTGYYKNQEKTETTIKDGWLDSGDILTWTTTGELKFAGRAKDTIVLMGGENLEPGPIEEKISESDFVNQVIVVGQDRKTLAAIIVPAWDRVKEALQEEGKTVPEDPAKWNEIPEIQKLFKNLVKNKVSADTGFKSFERISRIHLLHKEFEKGVEMTETMKLKRNVIFDMYADLIDSLYNDPKDEV